MNDLISFWFFLAWVLAGLQWLARWREIKWLHYLTKPGVMLALIVWSWRVSGWQGEMRWFALALIASLLGDVFLMLPPGFFLAGLAAFLMGHIFYLFGLNTGVLITSPLLWLMITIISLSAVGLVRFFLRALKRKPYSWRVRIPVALYIITIHLMVMSAASTFLRPDWSPTGAALVCLGALLFALSDGMLAYDRFVNKLRRAHVWIMMTYHLAQFSLLAGALLQFAG